ncbi:hypothetical protein EG329_009959 [Mollisiaceae sp. DMI_Dod_QoI]|nr:hypothetical protein EG329_009959 [Helotiales sp. DMI_Dod_QoI]
MPPPFDPVRLAFEKSIRDFKANLKNDELYKEILQTTTIEQVYDITDKLQEEQAKNGHMRHLSKIKPFLDRLRDYVGTIEMFVQVKPDILALIWGRLGHKYGSTRVNPGTKALGTTQYPGYPVPSLIWGPIKLLLQWTSVLKQSFDELLKTIADIGDLLPEFVDMMKIFGHNEQMKDVLALFFQDILDVYIIALKFFSLTRWKIIFEAMWPKQQDKIQLVMSHIERHASLMRNEVRLEHIREEHEARLRALEHFERTERSHQRQEYNAIKEAISPRMYEEELYRIRTQMCEGTGRWLLRDSTFAKWLKDTQNPTKLIWLQGIPGSGKTYLSSTVVDQSLSQGRTRTLFVFLSYQFRGSISALSIMHSLIFQLASDNDDLQAILCRSTAKELKRDLKRAVELLTTLLTVAGTTFIVVDGLDEVDQDERVRFLRNLLKLSNTCEEARILMTETQEASRPLNARILGRINNPTPLALREKARKLLGWVGSSLTPLTIREIEQALIVRMGDFDGDVRVIADLHPVKVCGPIIEVVDDYVQFVHFTAREYIFSPHITSFIDISDATLSLATCCIQYLCQSHHDTDLTDDKLRENVLAGIYRLHEYSATMWLQLVENYMRLTKSTTQLSDLINVIRIFIEGRSSNEFIDDMAPPPAQTIGQLSFKSDYPDVYEMLCKTSNFWKKCSEGEYDKRNGQ